MCAASPPSRVSSPAQHPIQLAPAHLLRASLAGSLLLVHRLGHVDLAQLTLEQLDAYDWAANVKLALEQPDFTYADVKALAKMALELGPAGRGAVRKRAEPGRLGLGGQSAEAAAVEGGGGRKRASRKRTIPAAEDGDDEADEHEPPRKQPCVRRRQTPAMRRPDWREEPDELRRTVMVRVCSTSQPFSV